MKKLTLTPLLILAFFLSSCAHNASLVNTSYQTLQTSQVAYDTSMKVAADLYDQGKIDEEEKAEIVEKANAFASAHNAAVEALAAYEESKDKEDQERLENQIIQASTTLSALLTILKPYIGEENE